MKIFSTIFLCLFFVLTASAQNLQPSIGLDALPKNSDPICDIPVITKSFDNVGYKLRDAVHDFTLYTVEGVPATLSEELKKGKPVLLVGGSYTCPVYVGKIKGINDIAAKYEGKIAVYVVYTVEAHPLKDPSPYSGKEWTTTENQNNGILYRQPTTYGERKAIVAEMLADIDLRVPVILDGPCNLWWKTYGTAPNSGYLIDTNGKVVARHSWFNRAPQNMMHSIDSLLGNATGGSGEGELTGTFTFASTDSTRKTGIVGSTIEFHGNLVNNSSTNPLVVQIFRKVQSPPAWGTALCADICYAPDIDTVEVYLSPLASQPFSFYMYSSEQAGTCNARLTMRNLNVQGNNQQVTLQGTTTAPTSVNENEDIPIRLIPQVAASGSVFNIVGGRPESTTLSLFDCSGKHLLEARNASTIRTDGFATGIYLYILHSAAGTILTKGTILIVP